MASKKTPKTPSKTKSAPRKRTAKKSVAPKISRRVETAPATITDEQRQQAIAIAAYLRAEQRGFAPGHELDDWIAAERDVEAASVPGDTTAR